MHANRLFSPLPLLALAAGAAAKGVWTTPHDSYSSSVGVLGCKINTDRVAYWPGSVDCNNICVKLSYGGRSVHLLRIDQSGGAYDISYDAWNYLQTGKSATVQPISGGTVAMEYQEADASECADLIHTEGSKLPLSASNSINFLSSCLDQPGSWVAKNHVLYNICDAICSLGHDEECTLDMATSNQPSCAHTLGLTSPLTGSPVYNIQYQTGKTVNAGTGKAAAPDAKALAVDNEEPEDSPASYVASSPSEQPAPKPAKTAAVFVEYSATSAPAEAATTAYPVASPSSESAYSAETSSSAAEAYPTEAAPSSAYSQSAAASQYTASPNASKPAKASTTLSVATVYSSKSAAGSSPTGPATVQTAGAALASGGVPALALVSGMIICSILGVF